MPINFIFFDFNHYIDNFQRCFVCDSDTHPECLNVNEQVDWQFAKVCLDYHDRCAAFVIREFFLYTFSSVVLCL